jgi:hypothetical protein
LLAITDTFFPNARNAERLVEINGIMCMPPCFYIGTKALFLEPFDRA